MNPRHTPNTHVLTVTNLPMIPQTEQVLTGMNTRPSKTWISTKRSIEKIPHGIIPALINRQTKASSSVIKRYTILPSNTRLNKCKYLKPLHLAAFRIQTYSHLITFYVSPPLYHQNLLSVICNSSSEVEISKKNRHTIHRKSLKCGFN